MSINLKYHKNYTELGATYQLILPLNLEGVVSDDDSVGLLSRGLEKLDYMLLYQAYSAKGRNLAVDLKTMFKILTYAYSQNIYSSRKIETAYRLSEKLEHDVLPSLDGDRREVVWLSLRIQHHLS